MKYPPLDQVIIDKFFQKFIETLYIASFVTVFVFILGVLIGFLLYSSNNEKLINNPILYKIVSSIINILRAIPFIILLILLMPFTNFLVGSISGPNAAIPTLIISISPFYSRVVELALQEVDQNIIETGLSFGATKRQIMFKLLFVEAFPAILYGLIITTISIISFSAMAGVIGAGGLGSLAYNEGFQRNNGTIMWGSTVLILFIVFTIQIIGQRITKKIDRRSI